VITASTTAATQGSPARFVRDSERENGSWPARAMPKMCRHAAVKIV
jgi:hypothetical protein